jgi:zinc/manganese transport system substrate-binding protein
VVATTSIWGDVTRNVACDGSVPVETIVPPGGDPHSFEPSLQDRETLSRAALVVANGGDLEASLQDTIDAAAGEGVALFRATDHVTTSGDDPHLWMDPMRVAEAVPALADALVAAGADADTVERCSRTYLDTLTALHAEVEQILAEVPPEQRFLVTSHEALAYFAERYDFTIIGAVVPGGSTLGETNTAELEELAAAIERTGVRAVFAEEQHSAEDIDALAAEVGDVSVISLFTDALGAPGSGAETYVDLLRTDARLVAEGLAG